MLRCTFTVCNIVLNIKLIVCNSTMHRYGAALITGKVINIPEK